MLYSKIVITGDDDYSNPSYTAKSYLENLAKLNSLNIEFNIPKSQFDLNKIYTSNTILLLPVRYDSFNLVAMDAIFSGCPTILSDQAGICDFLDSDYSGISYMKFSTINEAKSQVEYLLLNFNDYRKKIFESLNQVNIKSSLKQDFEKIYFKNTIDSNQNYYNSLEYKESKNFLKYSIQKLLLKNLSKKNYIKFVNLKQKLFRL